MPRLMIMTEQKFERLVRARIDEFAKVQRRSYEQELLMKQANLSALQSQINPHFLYNTLECIRGQALMEDSPDIAAAAQALSLFFRYSISGKSDIVTLKEELENLKNYMAIQSYRFKDRVSLQIDLEEEDSQSVLNALIPKLTLQPIVENAVVHGFASTVSGGVVTVAVHLTGPNISILVSDNGKGMDQDALELLNRSFRENGAKKAPAGKKGTGLGLQNVDKRIKFCYGGEYGLSVQSAPGCGTDVELFFPFWLTKH